MNEQSPVLLQLISSLIIISGTLYALAKQSKNLNGFKLARYAYEKLHTLRIPNRFQEAVDLGSVIIRSKPFQDAEVSIDEYRFCRQTKW